MNDSRRREEDGNSRRGAVQRGASSAPRDSGPQRAKPRAARASSRRRNRPADSAGCARSARRRARLAGTGAEALCMAASGAAGEQAGRSEGACACDVDKRRLCATRVRASSRPLCEAGARQEHRHAKTRANHCSRGGRQPAACRGQADGRQAAAQGGVTPQRQVRNGRQACMHARAYRSSALGLVQTSVALAPHATPAIGPTRVWVPGVPSASSSAKCSHVSRSHCTLQTRVCAAGGEGGRDHVNADRSSPPRRLVVQRRPRGVAVGDADTGAGAARMARSLTECTGQPCQAAAPTRSSAGSA